MDASEARLYDILDAIPIPLAINKGAGTNAFFNQTFVKTYGYTSDEIASVEAWRLRAYPDPAYREWQAAVWQTHMEEAERTGTFEPLELNITCKNGAVRTVLTTVAPLGQSFQQGFLVIHYDLTERNRFERELLLTQTTIDKSLSAFFRLTPDGTITYVNNYACQNLGYSQEELVGMHVWDIDPLMPPSAWQTWWEGITQKSVEQFESRHRRKDGTIFPIEVTANYIVANGKEYSFAFVQDITERKQAEQKLRLTHTAINKSRTAFFWLNPEGRVIYANDYACQSLGYTPEELVGLYIWDFDPDFPPEAQAPAWQEIKDKGMLILESRHQRKDGTIFPIEVTANYVASDGEEHSFVFVQDISERKAAQSEIHNLAFFDSLTGLPNRRLLMDRLQHALAASTRSQNYGAVLYLDLDNFKVLNDTKGHAMGDLLLIEVAQRLKACMRGDDTIARLGGDEFVVVLENLGTDAEHIVPMAKAVGDKVLEALSRPYYLRDYEHNSSASIGATLFLGNEDAVDDLLRRADTAMYAAKRAGRSVLRFFDPVMQHMLEERTKIEAGLRLALSRQEFQLHYQLQVNAKREVLGAEALIRWNHPREGMVSPARFIPLAEETGLILEIGQWVLDAACLKIKAWEHASHLQLLKIAINVSPWQFRQEDFAEQVIATISRHGIDPAKIKLEITESLVLHDVEDTIEKMRKLRAFGVLFAMDDFGTGYSSLSYLKRLPFDQIKIDQSFIRDISIGSTDAFIVLTVFTMGQLLGWEVIAEGVESEEQLELLQQLGCQAFQGYLFNKPMAAEDIERMLAAA